jgi:uncharacterized membrane protein
MLCYNESMNKTIKYSYLVTGIILIAYAILIGFMNVLNGSLILSLVWTLILAVICLYYSLKTEKINFLSNASRNLLWITVSISLVLTLAFLSQFNTAQEASQSELLFSFLSTETFKWGSIVSLLLMVASLFVKKLK